jgi:hypothetical protein
VLAAVNLILRLLYYTPHGHTPPGLLPGDGASNLIGHRLSLLGTQFNRKPCDNATRDAFSAPLLPRDPRRSGFNESSRLQTARCQGERV